MDSGAPVQMHMPCEDPGSGVNIAIWMCYIATALTVVAKVLTKVSGRHGIFSLRLADYHLDDVLCLCTLALATVQTILASQQVSAGIGQHYEDVNARNIRRYNALGFASQLLYILVVAIAKATGILFAARLRPSQFYRVALKALFGLLIVWTVVAFFGIAFQCKAPTTWRYIDTKCHDQFAFWVFVEVFNVLTDVALSLLLVMIVWVLQVPKSKKLVLVLAFASRLLIIPAAAVRLHYLHLMYRSQTGSAWDPTYMEAAVAIATGVAMCAAVIASCIPFLKPLVDSMQAGWSNSDIRKGLGFTVSENRAASTSVLVNGLYGKGSVIMTGTEGA